MSTRKKFLQNIGPTLPGMEISEQSENTISRPLTLLPAAFPARISALPENEQVSQEANQDYGQNSTASFASYDLLTSSWKTLQLSFTGELIEYSETYPRAGMMRNGKCYQRKPLVRRISGRESSLWLTPTVEDAGRQGSQEWRGLWTMGKPPQTGIQSSSTRRLRGRW